MDFTDSVAFEDDCPAVSLRENRRVAEIAQGSNPHWHAASDVVASFSDADFLLGFNTVQTTVAAAAELVEATVNICGDGVVTPSQPCDDGGTEPDDGCDGDCQIEAGWTCVGAPSSCALCRPDDLGFPDPANHDLIAWSAPGPGVCAGEFDVVRGDVAAFVVTGGFFGAECIADDLTATQIEETAEPTPGKAFWYLVRVSGDSWDPATGTVVTSRDPELVACP
jgi:cysteine-rich repeat protein